MDPIFIYSNDLQFQDNKPSLSTLATTIDYMEFYLKKIKIIT